MLQTMEEAVPRRRSRITQSGVDEISSQAAPLRELSQDEESNYGFHTIRRGSCDSIEDTNEDVISNEDVEMHEKEISKIVDDLLRIEKLIIGIKDVRQNH